MSKDRLTHIENLIIDMDGVLYRLNTPIAGAAEFLQFVRQSGRRFMLVTNNSTLTVMEYVHKLAGMGIVVSAGDILTAGEATAQYLAGIAPVGSRVYVIGENGIRSALQERGFVLVDDRSVSYVVVALDRQLTYDKLKTAALAIRAGARFIGTNPDRTLPTEEGLIPGARAILAAVETATGVSPVVVGKPEPAMLELALQRLQARPETTAIVGDGLETDIPGGKRLGLMTVLMMSGVTTAGQLARSPLQPDLVYADIAALQQAWAALKAQKRRPKRVPESGRTGGVGAASAGSVQRGDGEAAPATGLQTGGEGAASARGVQSRAEME